jgi:hypothetical protein
VGGAGGSSGRAPATYAKRSNQKMEFSFIISVSTVRESLIAETQRELSKNANKKVCPDVKIR